MGKFVVSTTLEPQVSYDRKVIILTTGTYNVN